jgi:DNA-binding PadR family transcriptional regulator
VLYAHPLRIKIASELYMREMSPTQAHKEFGGGSYGQILGHFHILEEHGWIRRVRSEKASEGRGRPRNIYRATELAVVDDDTWAELPTSIQVAFTARTLQHLGERVGGALAAGNVDTAGDRFFRCRTEGIDNKAWRDSMAALADCFYTLAQEQLDAKIRLDKSAEPGMLFTFAVAGFEMPRTEAGAADGSAQIDVAVPLRLDLDQIPLSTRMAKVFGDPVNLEIVKALHAGPLSPSQLHSKVGEGSLWSIDRRCQVLTELGWLTRADDAADERSVLYRAAGPEVFDADVWSEIPDEAKQAESWPAFGEFCDKASAALRGGSFNARSDRHLTSFTFRLDRQGWKQARLALRRCDKQLNGVAAAARSRAKVATQQKDVTPPYLATYLLAGFEDPVAWHAASFC